MWIISAVSLTLVMGLCVIGAFAPRQYYAANLAQCIGMAGVFMFSWPRLALLIEHREITSIAMPVFAQVVGHTGLALYAVGTAYKAWRHRPRQADGAPPARRATDHPLEMWITKHLHVGGPR
jgi:hypothetical protein